MQRLRQSGTAILYISHRLNEVMRLCDYVTVLKDGAVTADRSLDGVDSAGLVRLMVGRDPGDLFPRWTPVEGREMLVAVEGFSAGMLRDVDLEIRRGEVLGIGGLVGQGQEDLLLGLYGALPGKVRSAAFNGAAGPARLGHARQWPRPCLCPGGSQARGAASHPHHRLEHDGAVVRSGARAFSPPPRR